MHNATVMRHNVAPFSLPPYATLNEINSFTSGLQLALPDIANHWLFHRLILGDGRAIGIALIALNFYLPQGAQSNGKINPWNS